MAALAHNAKAGAARDRQAHIGFDRLAAKIAYVADIEDASGCGRRRYFHGQFGTRCQPMTVGQGDPGDHTIGQNSSRGRRRSIRVGYRNGRRAGVARAAVGRRKHNICARPLCAEACAHISIRHDKDVSLNIIQDRLDFSYRRCRRDGRRDAQSGAVIHAEVQRGSIVSIVQVETHGFVQAISRTTRGNGERLDPPKGGPNRIRHRDGIILWFGRQNTCDGCIDQFRRVNHHVRGGGIPGASIRNVEGRANASTIANSSRRGSGSDLIDVDG